MNEKIEFLLSRRSCRQFTKEAVSREDLREITAAACHAPTARNRQLWQFTVVKDEAVLEELYRAVGEALDREDYSFYGARAMILCSNEKDNPYGREDCACAMQNILLASSALGLGGVWINQLTAACEYPSVRAILSRLGVPENHVVYGSAALGHPAGEPAAKTVKNAVVWP